MSPHHGLLMTEDCQHLVISGHYTDLGHSLSHLVLQLNRIRSPLLTLSLRLFFAISFYETKAVYSWKSTSSNYWDVSKVKRSKTVSQQLPSLFPLDVWNVASFPALIWAQSTGEAPQVTRTGSLDCRARLSERDRCVIEDSQPWPTGMPDRRGGSDKQLPDLCMRTHTQPPVFMLL